MAIWDPIVQPIQGAINWIGTVVSPAPQQSVGGRSGNEPVVVSQPVTQPVNQPTPTYNPFGASGGFGGGGAGGGGTPVVSTPAPQPTATPAYNPFGASGGFGGGGTTGSSGQMVQNPVTGQLVRVTAETNPLANLVTGVQESPTRIVTAGIPTAAATIGGGVTLAKDVGADIAGIRTNQYQQNVASYQQQVSAYEKQVAAYEGRIAAYELGAAQYQQRVNELNYDIAAFNQLRPPVDQNEYLSRVNTLNTLQTRRDELSLLGAGLGAQQQELGTLRQDLLGVGAGLETKQSGLAAEKAHIESTGLFGLGTWFDKNVNKPISDPLMSAIGSPFGLSKDDVAVALNVNRQMAEGMVTYGGGTPLNLQLAYGAGFVEDALTKPGEAAAWAAVGLATGGLARALPALGPVAAVGKRVAGAGPVGAAVTKYGGKAFTYGLGGLFAGSVALDVASQPTPGAMVSRLGGMSATEIFPMLGGAAVGYRLPEIGRGAYQLGSHVADSKYLASLNREVTGIRAREFGVVDPGATKIQWRTGTKIPQRQVVREPSRRMDWNYATGKWEPAKSDRGLFDFLRVDRTQKIQAGRRAAPELESRPIDIESRIKTDYATGRLSFDLPSAEGRLALSDRFYRGSPESWLGKTPGSRTTRVIMPEGATAARVTSRTAMPDEFGRGRWTYSGFPEEQFTRVAESRVRRGPVRGSGISADVVNENYLRDVTRRADELAMQDYIGKYNVREFGLPASERVRLRFGEREVIGGGMKINIPESTRIRIKESRELGELYSWFSEKVTVPKPTRRVTQRPSVTLQYTMEQADLARREKVFPTNRKPTGAPGSPELKIKPTSAVERELPIPDRAAAAYSIPAMDVGSKGIHPGRSELPNVAGFVRGRRGVRIIEDEGYGSVGPLSFKPLRRLDEERNVFIIPIITGGGALASVGVQSAIAPTLSLPSDSATRDLVGIASLPRLDAGIREIMGVDVIPTVAQTPAVTQIPGLDVVQVPALDTAQIPGLDVLQVPDIIQVPALTPPELIPPDFRIPDIPLTPFEFPPLPPFPGFGLPIDGGGGGGGGGYFRWPFFFEETWDVGSPLDDYFGVASADAAYLGNIASSATAGVSTRRKRKKRQ